MRRCLSQRQQCKQPHGLLPYFDFFMFFIFQVLHTLKDAGQFKTLSFFFIRLKVIHYYLKKLKMLFHLGDSSSLAVLECLRKTCELYGDHFILVQYLPYCLELASLCRRKVSQNLEGGLLGSLAVVHSVIPLLSDSILMKVGSPDFEEPQRIDFPCFYI